MVKFYPCERASSNRSPRFKTLKSSQKPALNNLRRHQPSIAGLTQLMPSHPWRNKRSVICTSSSLTPWETSSVPLLQNSCHSPTWQVLICSWMPTNKKTTRIAWIWTWLSSQVNGWPNSSQVTQLSWFGQIKQRWILPPKQAQRFKRNVQILQLALRLAHANPATAAVLELQESIGRLSST